MIYDKFVRNCYRERCYENLNRSDWSKNDPRGEVNDQIRQLVLADTSTRSLGRSNNVSMYACTNELAFTCACACMCTSACCRCMGYFSLSPARANDVGVHIYPLHVHTLLYIASFSPTCDLEAHSYRVYPYCNVLGITETSCRLVGRHTHCQLRRLMYSNVLTSWIIGRFW